MSGRFVVVGLRRSGLAACEAIRRVWPRAEVLGTDSATDLDLTRLDALGVEYVTGVADVPITDATALVKSPGVTGGAPLVRHARKAGLPVWSEVELAYRLLGEPLIVGVTGTNGKTTTTELIGAMLREDRGCRVEVAGNVGRALTELAGRVAPDTWIVCELSSFQLEDIESFRPRIAVLLNLTPDHLDRHATLDDYRAAKLRVFENQLPEDVAVLPRGFGEVPGAARRIEFAPDDELPAEPLIPGEHNRENAAAAAVAARAAGLPDEAIAEGLRTFAGVPHRLELVREVGGVRFVNDSKATNPEAAERALWAYPPGIRLILGGSQKRSSYTGLARAAHERSVAKAYLIGESADDIAEALAAAGIRFADSGTLEQAVADAFADAEAGEVVLLSPACASYDQFRDFEDRGERFRELVEAL